ncbi:unnamed protein product [Bemisia tabaci]|uniref:Cytochrome P450 n=1 Tax=Bemisia tabaci TaxID=7038 RepID=A0A9P0APA4_BEMTA|nr:unnamed protein product [Bemisia tabaci]
MIEVQDGVAIMVSLIAILAGLIAFILKRRYEFWQRRNIPCYPRDRMFMTSHHKGVVYQQMYRELSPHPFGGFYSYSSPGFLVRDPNLIQRILIKDFAFFRNRGIIYDEKLDPLSANLFHLDGDAWRNIRLKTVAAFSSGKIKRMFALLESCASNLSTTIDSRASANEHVEIKELFSKFALDVIGSCAFGLDCGALKDKNSEFYRITRVLFMPSHRFRVLKLLNSIDMRLNRYLVGIKTVAQECQDFFTGVIHSTIDDRVSGAAKRTDFLQHFINLRQEEGGDARDKKAQAAGITLSNDEIAANSFVFFAAGFETISLTLTYCLLELSLNPEILDKVRKEMEGVERSHGGFTYEAIRQLSYTDMVVSETLRKYPVLPVVERLCVKSYTIPDTCTTIPPGMKIIIPTLGLHHDSNYFPNPEVFDPERFSDERRSTIQPGSYLPFGDGPRICIGMRFAQTEIKLALVQIIHHYNFRLVGDISLPVEVHPGSNMMTPKNKINMQFTRRQETNR